jgi:hypothetical protein
MEVLSRFSVTTDGIWIGEWILFIHSFTRQWLYSPLLGPGLFFSFVIFFTQTVGLLGRVISPSQGRYIHTGQHRHRINADTNIRALSGIRIHDPSVLASEGSSCLRPRGHSDRWWMDLLTTYTHHSELQVITFLLLNSLQITIAHAKLFPVFYVFNSSSLATASNNGDSSASRAQVISSQPSSQNSNLNWQLSFNYIPGWRPFHTNLLVFSSQVDFQLTTGN